MLKVYPPLSIQPPSLNEAIALNNGASGKPAGAFLVSARPGRPARSPMAWVLPPGGLRPSGPRSPASPKADAAWPDRSAGPGHVIDGGCRAGDRVTGPDSPSTPMCAVIPKCHRLPLFACLSRSGSPLTCSGEVGEVGELGAAMIVASTMVAGRVSSPFPARCGLRSLHSVFQRPVRHAVPRLQAGPAQPLRRTDGRAAAGHSRCPQAQCGLHHPLHALRDLPCDRDRPRPGQSS